MITNAHVPFRLGRRWFRRAARAVILAGTLAALLAPLALAAPLPNSVKPHAWSPGTSSWTNGQAKGYTEGETAAIVLEVPAGTAVDPFEIDFCVEVWDNTFNNAYYFTSYEAFSTTYEPPTLPDSTAITYAGGIPTGAGWDTADPVVWGYNLSITSVSAQAVGVGGCGANELHIMVSGAVNAPATFAYILMGGHIAAAGDPLPGSPRVPPDTHVPPGEGASGGSGGFKFQLANPAKSLSFQRADVSPSNGDLEILLVDCADFSGGATGGDPYVYHIQATNNGPEPANIVEMLVELPPGLTYDPTDSSSTPAATCSIVAGGNDVTCQLDDPLASGVTWDLYVAVTVDAGTPVGSDAGISVTISSFTTDPTPGNNDGGCVTTTPVTLAHVLASRTADGVRIEWSTATEVGNMGFNVYARTEDALHKLNDALVFSTAIDALAPEHYAFEADSETGDTFFIEDVDIRARTRLHGPFEVGQPFGRPVQADPVPWASIRAEHAARSVERDRTSLALTKPAIDLARRAAPDPVPEPDSRDGLTPDRPQRATRASAKSPLPVAQLLVDTDGLQRITFEALRDAGFDLAGLPLKELAVWHAGAPVPIHVAGDGNTFGPGAFVEFNGLAADSLYTTTSVYTLVTGRRAARRVAYERTSIPRRAKPAAFYMATVAVEHERAYSYAAPNGDPWYDAALLSRGRQVSRTFSVEADAFVRGVAPATLEIATWGVTDWPGRAPDHHMRLAINGITVADERFDGLVDHPVTVEIPEGVLGAGRNALDVTLPGDTGYAYDLVHFDGYRLTFPRAFVARDGRLEFTAGDDVFRVGNLPTTDVVVYRLESDAGPHAGLTRLSTVRVTPDGEAFAATFAGRSEDAAYLVYSADAVHAPAIAPVSVATSDLGLDRPIDLLVISHPDFIAGLDRLVAAREARGLAVRVVSVEDLYFAYGDGSVDPGPIRAFIADAISSAGTRFVMLVGGDTYDYLDYLGTGGMSFVPTLYAATDELITFAPVDPLYTDVDGDLVPDAAIGRLPVRTASELATQVGKILAYEAKDYGHSAVFAADVADPGISFADDSEGFIAGLPVGWTVQRAYVDRDGVDAARTTLLAAMNEGVALTSFVGHSGPAAWTFQGLFRSADAAELGNAGRPTVVTQWGCWNTYFVSPAYNTLGHQLLLAGDRGAAAVLGASTLTRSSSEEALGRLVTPRLVEAGVPLGTAIHEAKVELAEAHPEMTDVLLGWTLLGDPTLMVEPAGAP